MENNKKKLILVGGVVLIVLALVIVLSFSLGKKNGQKNIPEIINNASSTVEIQTEKEMMESAAAPKELSEEEIAVTEMIDSAKTEVPGGNLVTSDNRVITNEGQQTRNNVSPSDVLAPIQTGPVDKDELSAKAVNVEVSLGKFSPNEFRVKAGEPVTISLTSNDEWVHNLVFDSNILEAVRLSVMSGETRAITFQAPNIKGEYSFKCDVGGDRIGHVVRGEFGKMIVE